MQTEVLMVLCVFHKEKTPSLRIWPNGQFFCHGCQTSGHMRDYPDEFRAIQQGIERRRVELLEQAGQLRFPGFA